MDWELQVNLRGSQSWQLFLLFLTLSFWSQKPRSHLSSFFFFPSYPVSHSSANPVTLAFIIYFELNSFSPLPLCHSIPSNQATIICHMIYSNRLPTGLSDSILTLHRLFSTQQWKILYKLNHICLGHNIFWWFLFFLFFLTDPYWSIIAAQYCVSFCCTTKWISHMNTYIPISPPSCVSLPSPYPTPLGGHKAQSWSPCAMQLLPTS